MNHFVSSINKISRRQRSHAGEVIQPAGRPRRAGIDRLPLAVRAGRHRQPLQLPPRWVGGWVSACGRTRSLCGRARLRRPVQSRPTNAAEFVLPSPSQARKFVFVGRRPGICVCFGGGVGRGGGGAAGGRLVCWLSSTVRTGRVCPPPVQLATWGVV